jgi:hypothetical protein
LLSISKPAIITDAIARIKRSTIAPQMRKGLQYFIVTLGEFFEKMPPAKK